MRTLVQYHITFLTLICKLLNHQVSLKLKCINKLLNFSAGRGSVNVWWGSSNNRRLCNIKIGVGTGSCAPQSWSLSYATDQYLLAAPPPSFPPLLLPRSPEEVIKKLEKRVNALIEESAHARALGDYQTVSHCVCVWGGYMFGSKERCITYFFIIIHQLYLSTPYSGSGQGQRCRKEGEGSVQTTRAGPGHGPDQPWPYILCEWCTFWRIHLQCLQWGSICGWLISSCSFSIKSAVAEIAAI